MNSGSTILLCCVKPLAGKECFTAEEFLKVVGQLGHVLQIIIFSRKTIVKLFVEFSDHQAANKAYQTLMQADCEFGKIQAFPSDKPSIRCEQVDQRDYWIESHRIPYLRNPFHLSSDRLQSHSNDQSSDSLPASSNTQKSTILTYSTKTTQNDTFSQSLEQFCDNPDGSYRLFGTLDDSCSSGPSFFPIQNNNQQQTFWNIKRDKELALYAEPPSILLIHNFDHKSLEATNVAGLLSCWGVVKEVLVSKRHHLSFVTFATRSRECASVTARELSGNRLFAGPLQLEVVTDIHPKYIPNSSRPDSKRLIFRKIQTDIFTGVKPRLDTHVSRYLLITGASVFLTEESLITLLMEIGRPRSVMAVKRESPTVFQVITRNLSESVRLVALLQGLLVDDSRLVVQFTKEGHDRGHQQFLVKPT